jgi:hypothetical protein
MRENFTHFATAKKSASGFIGIFEEKPVGTGIAKYNFRTGIGSACDLSSSTNCQPTNEKPKTLLNI